MEIFDIITTIFHTSRTEIREKIKKIVNQENDGEEIKRIMEKKNR